jgi:hypothetical protein
MPFGLLGGWIFWRLGVRPAIITVGDVSPVFDAAPAECLRHFV